MARIGMKRLASFRKIDSNCQKSDVRLCLVVPNQIEELMSKLAESCANLHACRGLPQRDMPWHDTLLGKRVEP